MAVQIMERQLPQAGVREVSSALDFSDAVADAGFDVIVADCHFTWTDGLQLLQRIKSRYPDIPVVLLCGRVDARLQAELLKISPADFLLKSSAGFLGLPDAVQRALRRSELQRGGGASERRLESLLENSRLGTFRADWRGRLLEHSRTLAELAGPGSTRESLQSQLAPLHFQSSSPAEFQRQVEAEGRTHRRELEIPRPGDGSLWVIVTETAASDEAGNPVIDGLVEDITASRGLQRELSRSNQDLQDFAYVASHELQEPLRMIERYTKILAEEHSKALDADAAECVRFANEGARRMQTMIDDLLAFSRIETQGEALRDCDSTQLVEDALKNLRAVVEEKKAVVTWSSLPRILADPRQMTQLFQNLISNAVKFQRSQESPRIRITAQKKDGFEIFSVRDNGVGIETGELENVFGLFKRLDPSFPGSGLGLTICRRIVERHGGEIWAESEVGKGSTFHFKIPVIPSV